MICTDWDGVDRIHNFLCKYDPFNLLQESKEKNKIQEDNQNGNSDYNEYNYEFNNHNINDDLLSNLGNDDYDNNDNNDDSNDRKYRKIQEFKSISETLSENFENSLDLSAKKTQQPHVSKYNKKQPKLKSGTKLFALPKSLEENYNSEINTNINKNLIRGMNINTFQSIYGRKTNNNNNDHNDMALYASSLTSSTDMISNEFDYITFLKKAQKLAIFEVEKEEKNTENFTFETVNNSNSESESIRGNELTEGNQGEEGNSAGNGTNVRIEKGEHGPYRGVLKDTLRILAEGLVERDVEVFLYLNYFLVIVINALECFLPLIHFLVINVFECFLFFSHFLVINVFECFLSS